MVDYISRDDAIKDAESWVAVDEHEKRLQNDVIEWLKQLPSAQPEINCSEFPNNSDTISRQAAIDGKIYIQRSNGVEIYDDYVVPVEYLEQLPPAQPEIIYCKDCVKHNKGLGNYEVHPDGSTTWTWKDSACPLVSWRDKAQGHEFDYQFCAYAERREVTE